MVGDDMFEHEFDVMLGDALRRHSVEVPGGFADGVFELYISKPFEACSIFVLNCSSVFSGIHPLMT